MNVNEIDKNFSVETNIEREGLRFLDAKEAPFRIYGVFHDGVQYRRVPESVTSQISERVEYLAKNTAGGRVRFVTDSPYIAIMAKLPFSQKWSHMPRTCVSGFDMFIREDGVEHHVKTYIPPHTFDGSYDGVHDFSDGVKERLITINFPLYNDLHDLYIGIKDGSTLKAAPDYTIESPMVYYGSSITQGGCASRPGNCYQGYITRKYDANYINLGFSGNGKGEQAMADYIADLDMSMFIFDYDHNANSNEHYAETHEPFFKTIRAKHPTIPIVIMTRPKYKGRLAEFEYGRIETARKTYENAVASGDKNVWFIEGHELMEIAGEHGCVDLTHPNDLGFYSIAKRLEIELDKIIK